MESDIGKIVLIEWNKGFKLPKKKGKFCYINLTNADYISQAINFRNNICTEHGEYPFGPCFGAILDYDNQPSKKDQRKLEKA